MLDMLESQVLTRIKYSFPQKLKDKYPNLTFTNSDRNTETNFPTIYIHSISSETGRDLEGDAINFVDSAFQIDSITNTSQSDAKAISDEVLKIMKSMKFKAQSCPEFNNGTDVFRCTARFQRKIGEDDVL